MTKKEFYIIAIIVIFTYLSILFQVNLKNFVASQDGEQGVTFNFNAYR